jgi:hypothetical protein
MLERIRALIAAHMPDDSAEALFRRKLVGRFTVADLNERLAKRPERTPEIEELLVEAAFWWSMHHVATNVRSGSDPPGLRLDPKMLS